ncbi:MAG: hypothetical protein ACKVS9_01910 [Phycisphaerae bacterium]
MKRFLAVSAAGASATLALAAAPPGLISFQGSLDNNGTPVNGPQNMVFRLFSAPVGGDEIIVDTKSGANAVQVSDGLFTTLLGGGAVVDGSGPGIYAFLGPVFRDYSAVYVQTEVGGQVLLPRQQIVSVGFALDAGSLNGISSSGWLRRDVSDTFGGPQLTISANSTLNIAGSLTFEDERTIIVGGSPANLTIAGANMVLQLGDTISDVTALQGFLNMKPDTGPEGDQAIRFFNGGSATGESITWDDSDDRFEFSDSVAFSGPIQIGSISAVSELYSAFGSGTPVSAGMNNTGDVLVTDDIECLSSIIASGNILMRSNAAEGDATIFFREDASDTGESFRWDDSADKFVVSDAFQCDGNLTVNDPDNFADVQSVGGITIRIDTDNNDSGPNAGVFSINANAADIFGTPLLRMQSTDEANLELDNGVATDAFDFAEAFKPVAADLAMQPGDVVCLAVGEGLNEHVRLSTGAGEDMLLGVVSTNPAFTCGMGIDAIDNADPELAALRDAAMLRGDSAEVGRIGILLEEKMRQTWRPVALLGRVPCKVDTSNGPIKAGDRVTSSATTRGAAMRQTEPGMSIGIAMEDFNADGTGLITVLVRTGWYGGNAKPQAPAADVSRLESLERENLALKARLDAIENMVSKK